MGNFSFKNTYFFDNKGKIGCGFTYMYIQINNCSKNVYIFQPILRL
jgi:hypothetical protein